MKVSNCDTVDVIRAQSVSECEMKYSVKPYVFKKREVESLTDRRWAHKEKVGPRKSIHLTVVAASGLVPNTHSALVQKVLALDDLFREVLN